VPSPLAFPRDPLGTLAAAAAGGDAPVVWAGPVRLRLLAHPEAVREVLVTRQRDFRGLAFEATRRLVGDSVIQAQGDAHRRQRRVLQPAFHRERLPGYGAVMAAHAERWAAARHEGEVLAVREEMVALTLGIVGEALFGDADAAAVDDVRAYIDAGLALFGPLTLPVARWLERLPTPAARRFVTARARMDARVLALVAARERERAAGAPPRDDLLAMLLAARDAELAAGGPPPRDPDGARTLDARWARDEVLTLVLAGHETTASTLAWAWRLLAEHPEAEARLHAELDAVLGPAPEGRAPAFDDLARLPYTRAVVDEALRLWPAAPFVFRRATAPGPVPAPDGPAAELRAGETVVLSPWVTQRDARWWPDPHAFRPERWLDAEARAARPRFAWFPFGGGARVCIGEHFATAEAVLIVAAVARRWRLPFADAAGDVGPGPARAEARGLDRRTPTRPPDHWRVRVERRG
jgi:cytochrome P450